MKRALAVLLFAPVAGHAADAQPRVLRATGTVQALRSTSVQVPRISGQQQGNITLTMLIPNGTLVKAGDTVAEFDHTAQAKLARDAAAKFDDLTHQADQKAAEHRSNAAKRASDLAQAEADLSKARLEVRKGPVLSEIDQQKNQEKLKAAEAHVTSLKVSNSFHEKAEAAELEVLHLQVQRQKLTLERLEADANKLVIKAMIDGMVALQNVFRNNSLGHAQEGDQLYPGQPLLRIFDPKVMVLELTVSEADGAILHPGAKASVRLDAYPSLTFSARFDSASPVASSALGSPLKTFGARFLFEQADTHLLPDLSAAADIELSPVH
jgi:multidrug resistance efflux pump